MGQITWAAEAQGWLEDIFGYIAGESVEIASRTVRGIYDRAQILTEYPEIGHRYLPSKRNVRILLYGHYRVAYLMRDDLNIDILGVFHGSLDIDKYQL